MENQLLNSLRPRAGSVLSYGWTILWEKFITLFLISLVIWIAYMPMGILHDSHSHEFVTNVLGTFSLLYMVFLISPIKISAHYLYLKAARDEKFEVKELFSVFNNYLNVVLAGLLQMAIIGIGLAFIIVPGVIFACRLAFVPYLVMDKNLDPVKAVEESWRLTKGYGWRIFWIYIVSFFLFIAGLIMLVFGAVIAVMWINMAMASLYHAVLLERGEFIPSVENNAKGSNEVVENGTAEASDVIENKPE